jgi:hypothetical protein
MLESEVYESVPGMTDKPGVGFSWVGPQENGILVVRGCFDEGVIEQVHLLALDALPEIGWKGGTISGHMPNMKNSTDGYLTADDKSWAGDWSLEKLLEVGYDLKDLEHQVFLGLSQALTVYKGLVPQLDNVPLCDSGYQLQMYKKNEGFYREHVDSLPGKQTERVLGCVIYLNDVEQGGQTFFRRQDTYVKPTVGKVLLFPGLWTHPHESMISESDDKLIISTFIQVEPHEAHDH